MSLRPTLGGLVAGAIAGACVAAIALAAMRPPAPPEIYDERQIRLEAHGTRPRLVWTAGGSSGGPYPHQSAWLNANLHGVRLTLYLDDDDLRQIIAHVQHGVCPDYCPELREPPKATAPAKVGRAR